MLEAFAVRDHGVDVRSGVAGAIATAGPLAVGVGVGNRSAGLIAAVAGLNTALCVPRAGLTSRLWWGAVGGFGGCAAVVVADLTAAHSWLLAIATAAWVGIWALFRAAGSAGALAGFATSAVLVVLGGIPPGGPPLASRELWFATGAVAGLGLMVLARRGPRARGGVVRPALAALRGRARADQALRAHALRLALSVGLATAIERALKLPHGYWVPLTMLAIVQPGAHATQVRCVQRGAGTLIGVVVIIVITLLTDQVWVLIAGTAISSLALFSLDERGYFWLVVTLTPDRAADAQRRRLPRPRGRRPAHAQ